MISLRDKGGVGVDRNQAGPTYWLSDTDGIENIINWREVELSMFRDAIINAADQFPVLPAARHEDQKHVALAVHGYNNSWIDPFDGSGPAGSGSSDFGEKRNGLTKFLVAESNRVEVSRAISP
jgi:hypothetical protein